MNSAYKDNFITTFPGAVKYMFSKSDDPIGFISHYKDEDNSGIAAIAPKESSRDVAVRNMMRALGYDRWDVLSSGEIITESQSGDSIILEFSSINGHVSDACVAVRTAMETKNYALGIATDGITWYMLDHGCDDMTVEGETHMRHVMESILLGRELDRLDMHIINSFADTFGSDVIG